MKIRQSLLFFSIIIFGIVFLFSCRKESIPNLSLGIQEVYNGIRLQPIYVNCGLDGGSYEWRLTTFVDKKGEKETVDEVVSTQQTLVAILDKVGEYTYHFTYSADNETLQKVFRVVIANETVSYSPYITDVLDYVPAPGRFVNSYLGYATTPPDTYEEVLARCKTILCGGKINKAVSLGAFGGYVVFSFDHTVVNIPNATDFKIFSQVALYSPDGDPSAQYILSNSSPGVVWVAFDANNNGLPDAEEWYELYQPRSDTQGTTPMKRTRNYTIKYTLSDNLTSYTGVRLDSAQAREFKIPEHILWEVVTDNASAAEENPLVKEQLSGYLAKLKFDVYDPDSKYENREYWPLWRKDQTTITFTGTLLSDNGKEEWSKVSSATGEKLQVISQRWVLPGAYADNHPGTEFDIEYAIDKEGNRIHLPGIQFVKVQTGVNLQLGHHGSSCTELQGAIDLHL